MRKTTLYLPDELKASVESLAGQEGRSEAEIIREAIRDKVAGVQAPRPRFPLVESLGDPTLAGRVDELLARFGED